MTRSRLSQLQKVCNMIHKKLKGFRMSLLRIKKLMLDEMTKQKAPKFAIFVVDYESCIFFHFENIKWIFIFQKYVPISSNISL